MDDSRRIAFEIEGLLRLYHRSNGTKAADVWTTILQKKGRYKELSGDIFHSVPDVNVSATVSTVYRTV
jgi:hypothetical protein